MRVLIMLVVVASCGKEQQRKPAPRPVDAGSSAPASLRPGIPDVPAGRKLSWLLERMERDDLDTAQIEANFAKGFRDEVPPIQLMGVLSSMTGLRLVDASAKADGKQIVAHAVADGKKLRVSLTVDADTKIVGLLFSPEISKPGTWQAADQALTAVAPHVQLLAAEVDHGACKPLHALHTTDELAIGSAFKLYVLLAVIDQIAAGKLAWDRELEIRDDWKSLPTGKTQDDAAGTKLTLRELANRMISISDNSATDHLLYTVGRQRVETALQTAKHAKPALDMPLLSTRELFMLKLGLEAKEVDRYLAMPAAKRRTFLDKDLAGKFPPLLAAATFKTARKIDRLEWFASSEDLCRVMATLQARSNDAKLAALLDVLSINSGIQIDKTTWPYVGFKGGSEPGVLDLTWLLRRADGRWFVVTVTANSDEGGTVAEDPVIGVAAGAIDLIAKQK